MGLDSVELVMYIEELFDIQISNVEAERIATPNEIADLISQKIILNKSDRCKSQILFYILRDYVDVNFGYAKEEFMPSTIIGLFLPKENRIKHWEGMSLSLGLELPALSTDDLNDEANALQKLRGKMFSDVSVADKSVRTLVSWIVSLNYDKLIHLDNIFNNSEIRSIVIGAISEHQGIDVKEIGGNSRISHDLGIN